MAKDFTPVVTRVTQEEAENMMFGLDSIGYCRACGAERSGCEPDARGYECYECGEHFKDEDIHLVNGDWYCRTCLEE